MSTIHALGFQSVDPDEAGVAGTQWSIYESRIELFLEHERAHPNETDTEFSIFVITDFPGDPLADTNATSEWVDDYVWHHWGTTRKRRVVIEGSTHPGGEARRIQALRDSIDTRPHLTK